MFPRVTVPVRSHQITSQRLAADNARYAAEVPESVGPLTQHRNTAAMHYTGGLVTTKRIHDARFRIVRYVTDLIPKH